MRSSQCGLTTVIVSKLACRRQHWHHCAQCIQNAAAWLVFELHGCEHVTPSLTQLHWLLVLWRIYFKPCTILQVHTGRCPEYMKEIVHSQQHNSTSWTTLGSVKFNQLCRSTTMHEFQQMRVLLFQSRRVEFTSSTCPRRDGLSSIITLKDFLRHTLLV